VCPIGGHGVKTVGELPIEVNYNHVAPEKQEEKKKLLQKEVIQIDLEKTKTIADLVESFKRSSIQSRNIAKCAEVFENMLLDEERPLIMMGLSGALIAGGLRKVIRDMLEYGIVDGIVSTGAIMYQDIYQAQGHKHYMGSPHADDVKLRELWIDRIYDTYVDEDKFWNTDMRIGRVVGNKMKPGVYSTREFMEFLGAELCQKDPNSIVGTAKKQGAPIFVPAIADSSIGIGLAEYYKRVRKTGERVVLDPVKDNFELSSAMAATGATAAVYIGGGVPKNYINDAVVTTYLLGTEIPGHKYAFQITTDAPQWGALSGSTLEEAQSWGKVGGHATKATAYVEATIGLPLVVAYILHKEIYKKRKRRKITWAEGDLAQVE